MDIKTAQNEFFNPGREFSPAPFWFLNDNITYAGIRAQLSAFREKGIYGFVPHPRIGMNREIGYMTKKYLDLISFAADEAAAHGMYMILYDEASYPSGSAHGEVAKNCPEYANKGLAMRVYSRKDALFAQADALRTPNAVKIVSIQTALEENGEYTDVKTHASFDEAVPALGGRESSRLLVFVECHSKSVIRGLFPDEDDNGPNPPLYADVLNKKAVEKVLKYAFKPLYERLKRHFGSTIIAIFTDEPSPTGRGFPRALRPWTSDIMQFASRNGIDELDLCKLWYKDGAFSRRWSVLCDKLMLKTYYQPLSRWCEERGVALTGHPHAGDDIRSESFFHIPGQDAVWRYLVPESSGGRRLLNGAPLEKSSDSRLRALVSRYGCGLAGEQSVTAKCASDSARHRGRARCLNECFGAYGWELNMSEMKWLTDWLLVRGVNLISPHAFYYSIRDERSGERPPDVGPNNTWWPHMKLYSDYAARLCAVLARSQNTAHVAVVVGGDGCPYEPCIPLYTSQTEFNYLETTLFEDGAVTAGAGELFCAAQRYTDIVCREDLFDGNIKRLCEKSGVNVVLYNEDNALEAVLSAGLTPCVSLCPASPDIRVSRLFWNGYTAYFFTNEGEEDYAGTAALQETAGRILLLDAWRGSSEPDKIDSGKIPLGLRWRESVLALVFPEGCVYPRSGSTAGTAEEKEGGTPLALSFEEPYAQGTGKAVQVQVPGLWNGAPGMERFGGTVVCPFSLEFDGSESEVRVFVSGVHDFCEMVVNGVSAGVCFWPPFTFDITGLLRPGKNELSLLVTNSLANKFCEKNLPSGFTDIHIKQYNVQEVI